MGNGRGWWLVGFVGLVGCGLLGVDGFRFGAAEPSDGPSAARRSSNVAGMLDRLYSAAKERADRIRSEEGTGAGPMSGKDLLSGLMDYTTDKLRNPPLRSVERNLLMLQRDLLSVSRELEQTRHVLGLLLRNQGTKALELCELEFTLPHDVDSCTCAKEYEMEPARVGDCTSERGTLRGFNHTESVHQQLLSSRLIPVQGEKYTEIKS